MPQGSVNISVSRCAALATATSLTIFSSQRLFEAPRTEEIFFMGEMGFPIARKPAQKLRAAMTLALFPAPRRCWSRGATHPLIALVAVLLAIAIATARRRNRALVAIRRGDPSVDTLAAPPDRGPERRRFIDYMRII